MPADDLAARLDVHALYRDHHRWLYGWLRKRLGSDGFDAADLAHDTFVRLLSRPNGAIMHEPRAFLSTIARGLVIDHWRRRELELAWLEALVHLPEAAEPSPEERLQFLETLFEIDRLLAGLMPRTRKAFLLARLEGLTCPQIARQLAVSVATVERDIATALRSCYRVRFGA